MISPAEWKQRFNVAVSMQIEWDGQHYIKSGTIDRIVCKRRGSFVKEIFTPFGKLPPLLGGDELLGITCPECDP